MCISTCQNLKLKDIQFIHVLVNIPPYQYADENNYVHYIHQLTLPSAHFVPAAGGLILVRQKNSPSISHHNS